MSMDLALLILANDGQPGRRIWRLQSKRPMWPVPVVVLDVDPKDLLEVAASDDEQPVQALAADGADPAFRVGVCSGRPHRRDEHFGAFGAEHIVEVAAELRVAVTHD